ncbi:MAG: hypothetical protein ABGZ53_19625, partial [Fuerstiella sp.]
SASMSVEKRQQQQMFVASLLAALGPQDKFNLAVSDVECHWRFEDEVEPTKEAVADAIGWLDSRLSLGWTDLDRMTESVLGHCNDNTHVVYIGDGIVTARDADTQTFVNRLQRLVEGQASGSFHAISVGNNFESIVLKALARVGGGSVRQIGGEQTPQRIAFELLNEISQPGLRNLKVEFQGLKVAAIYPRTLPNLAAGTQQILIGRYLPQGSYQSGEIIITGERNGEEVRFASRISFADAESGNSFIPRLWARAHLDHLLEQGSSTAIRDDVIAMSEEFHIITPYTSLLVLETDDDRERFGVKRRYQMRDGERFFADGRDHSAFELLQQQMKRAGDWRLGLRRRILFELTRLGRNSQVFQQDQNRYGRRGGMSSSGSISNSRFVQSTGKMKAGWGGGGGFPLNGDASFEVDGRIDDEDSEFEIDTEMVDFDLIEERVADKRLVARSKQDLSARLSGEDSNRPQASGMSLLGGRLRQLAPAAKRELALSSIVSDEQSYRGRVNQQYVQWVHTLFPAVPAVSAESPVLEVLWNDDAVAVSNSLLQAISLTEGGIEVVQHTQSSDPRWQRTTAISDQTALYSPQRWLHFTQSVGSQTHVHWSDAKQRGVCSRAFQLGRVRKSDARDLIVYSPGQRAYAVTALHDSFRNYEVKIERPSDDRILVTLIHPTQQTVQRRITIDSQRNVVVQQQAFSAGKLTSTNKYSNYTKVAGVWWPGKTESFDALGRGTTVTTQSVRLLNDDAFEKRFAAERPNDQEAILLAMPLPTLRQAQIAAADGSATFEHRLLLLLQSSGIQKWTEVLTQLEELEKLAVPRPGVVWIRAAVLISARRNEDARQLLQKQLRQIVSEAWENELSLANYLLDQLSQVVDANEALRLLDVARAIYNRQPAHAVAERLWSSRRITSLRSLGRFDEVLQRQEELAKTAPWDLAAQTTYAADLKTSGDYDGAYAWLRQEIDRDAERTEYELKRLRDVYASFLRVEGRSDVYVAFMNEWLETQPTDYQVYQQYLSALEMANRVDDADAAAWKWMQDGSVDGLIESVPMARLNAAVSYALGQRYQQYMSWLDPIWLPRLEKTAEFFIGHELHHYMGSRIVNDYRFTRSDESDRIRTEVAGRLQKSCGTLREQLVAPYVGWVVGRDDLSNAEWQKIADVLRGRWNMQEDLNQRSVLGGSLAQIYATHFGRTEYLPFLRARIVRAEQAENLEHVAIYRLALFNVLLAADWSDENEQEALSLVGQLSPAKTVSGRLVARIGVLHHLVDRMMASRNEADMKRLLADGHPEDLTRTEYSAGQAEFIQTAREGIAAQLAEEVKRQADAPRDPDSSAGIDELLKWIQLERMYLDVKLGRNLEHVAAECWSMLGDAPIAGKDGDEVLDDDQLETARQALIAEIRRERAFATVSYLALRRSAPKTLVKQVLEYISAGLQFDGDAAATWKQARFRMLVALDRPDELETELRQWILSDEFPAAWQLVLGRLQAERGKIDEAIGLFETVERHSQLSPGDYQMLGDWYLVVDQRESRRRAKVEVFMSMEEHQINSWLWQQRRPWYQTDVPLPTELDENVLFAFQAMFEKSNQPQNYVNQLRDFYTACRDFRLLKMLPDSITGRTPQQIYPFLESLRTNVMHEIRNEATADEILKRIVEVRSAKKSATDLRALDLLEAMIERQSAEVLNQPGPHIDAAVEA